MGEIQQERKRPTILVVDDEKTIRILLKKFLVALGYDQIEEAGNGQEAVEKVEHLHPKLILLDIKMPIMDGLVALKKIKEIDKNVIIIMITAYPYLEGADQALVNGAFDFIVKPFDIRYLETSIKTGLLMSTS